MKNFTLSVATVLALSTFAIAGGDIAPVEPMVEAVAPATDDSGFYIGGAYSMINTEVDAVGHYGWVDDVDYWWSESSEIDTAGFMLQLGYQFNKYIAVEGRYWKGQGSVDTSRSSGTDGQTNFTDSWSDDCDMTAYGIYLKPMYPVTDALNIYGLLGYGNTKIENDWYGDGQDLIDESDFQWGIGLSYAYDEKLSFFVDYVQLASDAENSHDWNAGQTMPYYDYDYVNWETSVSTVNVGISYKF